MENPAKDLLSLEKVERLPSTQIDAANVALRDERLIAGPASLVQIANPIRLKDQTPPEWIYFSRNGGTSIRSAIAAETFVKGQSGNLLFHQSAWWTWNGQVWEEEEEIAVKAAVRRLLTSHPLGKELTKTTVITDVTEQIRLLLVTDSSFPGFDADMEKIVLQNGTLYLKGKPVFKNAHIRRDYRTIQLGFNYDPQARCPRFMKFLYELELDRDTQCRLQEWAGYLLIPTAKLQRCLLLIGEGANGKSMLLLTLQAMLGKDNVSSLEMAELFDRFKVAMLRGKLANIATDVETSQVLDARFKKLVAGEPQVAEQKYRDPFEFNPFARLLFSANDFIPTKDRSLGFFRRFDVIRFNRVFDESEQDKDLAKTLRNELPGIFNWALAGLVRLEENNWKMTESLAMKQAHEDFKRQVNPLINFLEERCTLDPQGKTSASLLRYEYVEWCKQNGYHPLSDVAFGKELKRLHKEVVRQRESVNGVRSYQYFGLVLN